MNNFSMAPSSSSSKSSFSPHHPLPFTPIQEGNEDEEYSQGGTSVRAISTPSDRKEKRYSKHKSTPLHDNSSQGREKSTRKKKPESDDVAGDDRGVSCNKCRPGNREKISVVPLDNSRPDNKQSLASPNGIFKSILSSLVRKSPRSSSDGSPSTGVREEQWKIAVAELSHKLMQATRKRDEAILEASRLKYSMAELEKKLNKVEIYCHNVKYGLEEFSGNPPQENGKTHIDYECIRVGHDQVKVIDHFLVSVAGARSSVRVLSRSLSLQLRQMGGKVYERISILLHPYDIKISVSRNPRGLLFYLEALLNKAFFEDFESTGFQKSAPTQILNPMDRCEENFTMFNRLRDLTWEEVLNKGTRHFSEGFSRFCDRKMSEIVGMLGWNRAWPEPLLQAFFGASKNVWLVHLLANSVHPNLPIFRVDKGVGFDSVYMEDVVGDKARKLVPTMVRIMVAPGFYVYDNVVKCKVLCRYFKNVEGHEKGLTPSPL